MRLTRGGKALYMHYLPADISGVSCVSGEMAASVFDRYRNPLYKQASYKPYIIAAMISLAKVKNPQKPCSSWKRPHGNARTADNVVFSLKYSKETACKRRQSPKPEQPSILYLHHRPK